MPRYTYDGVLPRTYPEARDETGVIVGHVYPGDAFDLAEPLDGDWRPESDAERPPPAAVPPPPPPPAEPADTTTPAAGTQED